MKVHRILLAEDSDNDAELTLAAMAEHGMANHIDRVRDGVEALQYLRCEGPWSERSQSDPVVVLLDLKMPRLGGLETLAEIRGDAVLRRTPVVILTSSREESDLIKSYDLGVNAYVVKPVGFEEFSKAVHDIGCFWVLINEMPPLGSRESKAGEG